MNPYALAVSVHVVIALLGVGVLAAIPLGARSVRRAGLGLEALRAWVQPLFRLVRAGLIAAFLSGALLDYIARGAFHQAGWFRVAALLLVLAAICQARAQSALKRGLTGKVPVPVALRGVERWGNLSISAVACIAVLMEWKPF